MTQKTKTTNPKLRTIPQRVNLALRPFHPSYHRRLHRRSLPMIYDQERVLTGRELASLGQNILRLKSLHTTFKFYWKHEQKYDIWEKQKFQSDHGAEEDPKAAGRPQGLAKKPAPDGGQQGKHIMKRAIFGSRTMWFRGAFGRWTAAAEVSAIRGRRSEYNTLWHIQYSLAGLWIEEIYRGMDGSKLDMAGILGLSSGTSAQHRNINSQSIVGIKSDSVGRGGWKCPVWMW